MHSRDGEIEFRHPLRSYQGEDLAVTPVKTGVQEVIKGLKNLDSGFCRNDATKTQIHFLVPSHPVMLGHFVKAAKKVPSSRLKRSKRESLSLALEITSTACWVDWTG